MASTTIKNYVKSFESLKLVSYLCPANVWTIGWGTTVYPNRVRVKSGDVCTKEQAQSYFDYDVNRFCRAVNLHVSVYINQNQLDALVSLVYNIGIGNFKKSSLLRELNSCDYDDASKQFLTWCKSRNRKTKKLKVLLGLQIRRKKERKIFDTPPDIKNYISAFDKLQARGLKMIYSKKAIFNIRTM
jgi:lysozyme